MSGVCCRRERAGNLSCELCAQLWSAARCGTALLKQRLYVARTSNMLPWCKRGFNRRRRRVVVDVIWTSASGPVRWRKPLPGGSWRMSGDEMCRQGTADRSIDVGPAGLIALHDTRPTACPPSRRDGPSAVKQTTARSDISYWLMVDDAPGAPWRKSKCKLYVVCRVSSHARDHDVMCTLSGHPYTTNNHVDNVWLSDRMTVINAVKYCILARWCSCSSK